MTAEPAPDKPKPAAKMSRRDQIITAAVVALCCGGGLFFFSKYDPSTADQPGTGTDAERVCEDFVRDRLKAPGSAEFGDMSNTGSGTFTFTVTGNVDAQNSFGAMLRMRFTCVVRDAGTEWRLVSLTGLT